MSGRLFRVQNWEELARAAGFQPANMAALGGVSSRQLQRFFREQFQTTPRKWLRQLQCRDARQLIGKGYSNIAVVAELKFASESHFCREFKKVHGASPQTFSPAYKPTNVAAQLSNRSSGQVAP